MATSLPALPSWLGAVFLLWSWKASCLMFWKQQFTSARLYSVHPLYPAPSPFRNSYVQPHQPLQSHPNGSTKFQANGAAHRFYVRLAGIATSPLTERRKNRHRNHNNTSRQRAPNSCCVTPPKPPMSIVLTINEGAPSQTELSISLERELFGMMTFPVRLAGGAVMRWADWPCSNFCWVSSWNPIQGEQPIKKAKQGRIHQFFLVWVCVGRSLHRWAAEVPTTTCLGKLRSRCLARLTDDTVC